MSDNSLLIEYADGVCNISLNKPQLHNAFDDKLILELTQALSQAQANPAVAIVVLRAIGKNFSAGADLNWMQKMAGFSQADNIADAGSLALLLQTLDELSKPTIAAIQGAALGGAIGLIACCDIALAAENAYFCFSEVKLGLVPAVISPYIIRAMGEKRARYYFLTAQRFDANLACQHGLVHQVVDDLDAATLAVCQQLKQNCPQALAQAKQLLRTVAQQAFNNTDYTCQALAEARARQSTQQRLADFLTSKK
jgi:methylglutaconyl-CoA hydratase